MTTPLPGRRRDRGLLTALNTFLDDLRNPTTPRAKFVVTSLAVAAFALVSLVIIAGFFLSRILMPMQVGETFDPTSVLGTAETAEFQTPDGQTHRGWFFPGLRGAPVVVVCHGYRSSRSEVLTLATSLQQHRYNVFVFNFSGHGENPVRYTTLGYWESRELLAALQMLSNRTDVDKERIGLWGYSLGGYAALSAAANVPGVKAIVVDSVYAGPATLLRDEMHRLGADSFPLLVPVTTLLFHTVSLFQSGVEDPDDALSKLAGVPKLFIVGGDNPQLAESTRELYEEAPQPKELSTLPRSNLAALTENERRTYENLVVGFFLRSLPLLAPQR